MGFIEKSNINTPFISVEQLNCQALPGSAQSMREIMAILNDPTFLDHLGSYPITEICQTENGWIIKTADREIRVDVNYLPQDILSPQPFELKIHDPIMTR